MSTNEAILRHITRADTFAAHLNIRIQQLDAECGVAVMPLEAAQRNGQGHAHGGAIFALADMAFAAACQAQGVFWVNAQSSISYLEPGRIGPLRGEARQVRAGRRLGTYEVRITDADGTLVALATITGYNTSVPIPLTDDEDRR